MTIEEENIFQEYADIKIGFKETIKSLREDAPDIYFRFQHIINALDEVCILVVLNADEIQDDSRDHIEELFDIGVYQLLLELEVVYQIAKIVFNNNYDEFNEFYKEFNLYLEALSLLQQVERYEKELGEKRMNKYIRFVEEVKGYIIDKKVLPIEKYEEFDKMTRQVNEYGVNYVSYNQLLWMFAEELNII